MRGVTMLSLMVAGAVLQAVFPTGYMVGHTRVPVLLSLVIYYALTRSRGAALRAALLAGVFQDALSLIPLGYSSFCFCLVAWAINKVREEVYTRHWTTHVFFGGLGNALQSVVVYLLLTQNGSLELPLSAATLKFTGALALGAVSAPIVFRATEALEVKLGMIKVNGIT